MFISRHDFFVSSRGVFGVSSEQKSFSRMNHKTTALLSEKDENMRSKELLVGKTSMPTPVLVKVKRDLNVADEDSFLADHFIETKKTSSKRHYPSLSTQRQPLSSFIISAEAMVRSVRGTQLEALVTWEVQGKYPLSKRKPIVFNLHWARNTCNLDDTFPHCEDADVYKHELVPSMSLKASIILRNLSFNSRYWVEIRLDDLTSHKVWLNTKGCHQPTDNTFKKCLDDISDPEKPLLDPNLNVNITCLYFDRQTDLGHAWLEWHDLSNYVPQFLSSKNNISRIKRPQISTNLKNEFPAVKSSGIDKNLKNILMVRYIGHDGPRMQIHHPPHNKFSLELQPDVIYDIRVGTTIRGADILFNALKLNISRSSMDTEACYSKQFGSKALSSYSDGQANSTILILCFVLLFVFAIAATALILCLFTKCKKAHTKLLKRTLLAKNNSYKTAPGGMGSTYTKEEVQLVLSDEWELDAKEVTLGAEIGQGAFGLVMTGYYRNKQVAIKVLKGDVSPTHREELLREIDLMKRIGPHTNIVGLIGACTLRDPIALIMEYMPFGNLQTFLQKCRLEGELRRTEKGMEMTYSPLDQLTGTKEFWNLTSTDLLSFARQISVAMEFLTNKKYVHRDLAARNILVSNNKIVKLCDFGLARIVHNGDHYCKLTNGRLPLKWMALESIRDRIFTAQSDVWSYGVLLWEVTTLGCTPYPDVPLVDLYRMLSEGYRMEKPKNCSPELYSLMHQCWYEEPSKRPNFTSLRTRLEIMLSQKGNYLDLELVDISTIRSKRPPTPVQPIEYRHSSPRNHSTYSAWKNWKSNDKLRPTSLNDSDVIWRTSDSNEYQEPRKTLRLSSGSNLKDVYWPTTLAGDNESNFDDDVFDQLV